jgi:membrane fusion protein (multidrug efflux system)
MFKRMLIMLLCVGVLFGGIFGYKAFISHQMKNAMGSQQAPAVTVSTTTARMEAWQPQLTAVGTVRAMRGVDVTSEIAGLVRNIYFKSGDDVKKGQVLVQLNADADRALLHSLEAEAELAKTTYHRDAQQFHIKAISQATLDVSQADLKSKKAQVDQQAAVVDKKTIRAPFSGRVGISTVNPGQYVNPGDHIVTLQSFDSVYVDFFLPQEDIARINLGQTVVVNTDTYPGKDFKGKITAISPEVDPKTRNIEIEATIANPKHDLLPGMFTSVQVKTGELERYITLPQTTITYNPYGETVFLVVQAGQGPRGKPELIAKQTFVTIGGVRGDQVSVLKGIKVGDSVVTGGQLKLKSGNRVIINNKIQPSDEAYPRPTDQ